MVNATLQKQGGGMYHLGGKFIHIFDGIQPTQSRSLGSTLPLGKQINAAVKKIYFFQLSLA